MQKGQKEIQWLWQWLLRAVILCSLGLCVWRFAMWQEGEIVAFLEHGMLVSLTAAILLLLHRLCEHRLPPSLFMVLWLVLLLQIAQVSLPWQTVNLQTIRDALSDSEILDASVAHETVSQSVGVSQNQEEKAQTQLQAESESTAQTSSQNEVVRDPKPSDTGVVSHAKDDANQKVPEVLESVQQNPTQKETVKQLEKGIAWMLPFVIPVWRIGTCVLAVWFIVVYILFTHRVFRVTKASSIRSNVILEACKETLSFNSKIYVREGAVQPMLIGLFTPCVLLPVALVEQTYRTEIAPVRKGNTLQDPVPVQEKTIESHSEAVFTSCNEAEVEDAPSALELILLHEICHAKHDDNLWSLVAVAVLCLQWYNPLVWLCFAAFKRDVERRCDLAVLRYTGNKRAYAQILLDSI